tara:strand:+ start:26675 stop:26914 length:240 start_codon:yes stop_codon:yes gene_type:complete
MNQLPNELINIIYVYEGRYHENYNKLIKELYHQIEWFKVKKETIISSMIQYSLLLDLEQQRYLMDTKELTFSNFFFNKR